MHLPTKLQILPKSAHQRWNDPLAHWPHSPFKHTLLIKPFITWKMNTSELMEIPHSQASSIHPCSWWPHYKTRRICLHKSNPVGKSSRSRLNSKTTKWCIHDRRSVPQHQSKYCHHNQLGKYQKVHKFNEMQQKKMKIHMHSSSMHKRPIHFWLHDNMPTLWWFVLYLWQHHQISMRTVTKSNKHGVQTNPSRTTICHWIEQNL